MTSKRKYHFLDCFLLPALLCNFRWAILIEGGIVDLRFMALNSFVSNEFDKELDLAFAIIAFFQLSVPFGSIKLFWDVLVLY